tara:strand:- start:196 stop:492 length:297 start_codon:yes stop_codon:yes gene_type:complete
MELLTKEIEAKLRANHKSKSSTSGFKYEVKLFNPTGRGTWYLSELDDDNIAFGLCDLGYPELGYVSLDELKSLKLPLGLKIERDLHWDGKVPGIIPGS